MATTSVALLLSVFSLQVSNQDTGDISLYPPPDLAEMAVRYCIEPDGDHRLSWHLAERDGFRWLSPHEFEGLRLPGVGTELRGLEREINGISFRIITSSMGWQSPDDGKTYFRFCWVSASQSRVELVNLRLANLLGVSRFRSQNTYIFAWIPKAGDSRQPVIRRDFMRNHLTLSREQGLRRATTSQRGPAVFVGYASPRDESTYRLFDWSGPEPTASD